MTDVNETRIDITPDGFPTDNMPSEAEVNEQRVKNGKNLRSICTKIGFSLLIVLAAALITQIIAVGILNSIDPKLIESTTVSIILSSGSMYFVGMALGALVLLSVKKTAPKEKKPLRISQFFVILVICFGGMYSGNLIGTVITSVISAITGSEINNAVADVVSSTPMLPLFIFVVVIAPIFEELFFRKLMIDRLLPYGQWMAVLVSSVLFGLFHCNISQLFYATLLGAMLGFIYARTGKIHHTILLHAIINFCGSIIPMWVLRMCDIDVIMEFMTLPSFSVLVDNLGGILIYLAYSSLISLVWGAGVTMFIVFAILKKFKLGKPEFEMPCASKVATLVITNPGIIIITVGCLILTVLSLF